MDRSSRPTRPAAAASSDSKIKHLQAQAAEVQGVMYDALDQAMKRDELLADVEKKADHLGTSALKFRKEAKAVKQRMWWQNMRLTVIIALIVIILLTCIIVPIVIRSKQGTI